MQIIPSIHMISKMMIYEYLIIEEEKIILIDTGLPGSGSQIIRYIHSLNRKPEDISHILITHADGDHYGSVGQLRINPLLIVCTSDIEARAIQTGSQSRPLKLETISSRAFNLIARRLFKASPVHVDRILNPGEVLPVLGGLHVLDTCGHTPGHLSFFSPSMGVLFAGDSIVIKGNKLFPSTGMNTWNETLAVKSFEEQLSLNPGIICAGHGMLKRK